MMKKNLIYCVSVAVLAMVVMIAGQVNADTVELSGLVNEPVNADVRAVGDLIIGPDGYVNGNIETDGFRITVLGTVDGNIKEKGLLGVAVTYGSVNGNIEEKGGGGVIIVLGDGDSINGNVKEEAGGGVNITVELGGVFNGNAEEKGKGGMATNGDGVFNGNTKEEDFGICTNTIVNFFGNACE